MKQTVIIATAGLGSRMGKYTENLNKALLPYKNKPVLGHIIEQFPKDTKFVIPVGYLSQQVKDFCAIAYNDRHIEYVEVDDYTSPKSGTGYSLLQCKDVIDSSFWYVTCDTYFDQTVVDRVRDNDCYFVKTISEDLSELYTMFEVSSDFKIADISFKQKQDPANWTAWTGLMYINNHTKFFKDLSEHNGTEIVPIIKTGSDIATLSTWLDFGSAQQYEDALRKSQKFDFSKQNEITYICNNRVVKWWTDSSIAKKKYDKALANPKVFPANCEYVGNFMAYDYFEGQVLYDFNNPVVLTDFLSWLKNDVWTPVDYDIKQACTEFYKTKTLGRINKFLEKYPNLSTVNNIDGVNVKDYKYYLDKIDWDYLSTTNLPGFIHGDLQFDNVVINSRGEFKVIDWRHEFADIVEFGDIYYDISKLAGGFIINYANIKNDIFKIDITKDRVNLTIPNIDHIEIYQKKVKDFVNEQGYDYKKVQMLIPIIFWNMSPLHTAPFDLFLWYLGIKLFAELDHG